MLKKSCGFVQDIYCHLNFRNQPDYTLGLSENDKQINGVCPLDEESPKGRKNSSASCSTMVVSPIGWMCTV